MSNGTEHMKLSDFLAFKCGTLDVCLSASMRMYIPVAHAQLKSKYWYLNKSALCRTTVFEVDSACVGNIFDFVRRQRS